jgi:2-iminobutanoate/2-iminopropanoate deaminase
LFGLEEMSMAEIELSTAKYPFSPALVVGHTLYVSGHLGLDLETGKCPADLETEARAMMDAFRRTIEAAGFAMDDLVTATIFCTDLSAFATFNAVYTQYFQVPYPARAFIGVDKLLLGTHFEIQGTAVRDAAWNKQCVPK